MMPTRRFPVFSISTTVGSLNASLLILESGVKPRPDRWLEIVLLIGMGNCLLAQKFVSLI